MFRRILVALDNSDLGETVFQEALAIANATQANLMLLHILSDSEVGYLDFRNLDEHLDNWEQYKQQGLLMLQSRWAIASEAGVNATFLQIPGAAPTSICRVAQSWNADLIVIGQRALDGMQRLIQGSVSNYVLHRAPCSVMTVHAPAVVGAAR
jgi:nucleotide-binding universal stress UspA family protein